MPRVTSKKSKDARVAYGERLLTEATTLRGNLHSCVLRIPRAKKALGMNAGTILQ